MQTKPAVSALFSSVLLIAALPTAAQNEATGSASETENAATTSLDNWFGDPLIVTASGFEQRSFDTPYIIDVVGQDEIRDYGIRTVPSAARASSNTDSDRARGTCTRSALGGVGFQPAVTTKS